MLDEVGYEIWIFDAEVFPNYCGIGFLNPNTSELRQFSNFGGPDSDIQALIVFWRSKQASAKFIGFNCSQYRRPHHRTDAADGTGHRPSSPGV